MSQNTLGEELGEKGKEEKKEGEGEGRKGSNEEIGHEKKNKRRER